LKKKLLSPVELKELRLQQEEQRKLRAEEEQRKLRENLNKNSKRLTSPKDLLDPQPVVEPTIEIKEEPVVVEEPKDPIEVLRERLEEVAALIKEPKYYDEELAKLEVQISSKVNLEEYNLEPVNQRIGELREYVSELPENVDRLTERVDELQVSGSEIFQQHGESLREIKKVTHQMLKDLDKLSKLKIPEAFDPSAIQNDIASTKETFYERVAELKKEISQLPEVKYYDTELIELQERIKEVGNSIPEIPEDKYYEDQLELLSNKIEEVRSEIPKDKETFYERVAELKQELSELPEVKYYDDELTQLQERIEVVRDSIPEIPEIKYYDDDLESLLGLIEEVRGNVSQLPEVKYYENEISQIEEAIKNVENRIPTVPEVRYYEDDIEALREEIKNVEGQIPEVPEIPEIKYYDEEVEILSEDIDKVRDSIIDIKLAIKAVEKSVEVVEDREIPEAFDPTGLQIEIEKAFKEIEKLKEQPVTVKEDADPLLPLDQKFVTFDDLATHYRTFINRVQQQLMSLGGGGEVNLRYLDDIDRSSISDGKVLSYDAATNKFKFISPGAASSLWNEDGADIYRNSNVGINSADPQVALDVVGDVNVTGVITATSFTGSVAGDVSGTLTGEFVSNLDKTLEYQSGTLSTITTSEGTKTFYYDGAGILTSIVGTGVYVSKEFTYDGGGNLISVNVL
jgi:predicted  nucleic acid-binding Zn-ribbon protein